MIEANNLSKEYGPVFAVQDVTFQVEKGEILGFLGPNGAGKTTTMRILAGCLAPTGGTARVARYDIFEDTLKARQSLGYLPEMVPLYPEMSVREYLGFAARLHGLPRGQVSGRMDEVLDRCGLGDVRSKLIGRLSRGYRQRVGLAQALIHNPPVLILDEPTVGLDPRQIIEIRELIRKLAGDHTVLLSTHILPEVSMICSRVMIIDRGRVVARLRLERDSASGSVVVEEERPAAEGNGTHPGTAAERSDRFVVIAEGPLQDLQECLGRVPGVLSVSARSDPHPVEGSPMAPGFTVHARVDDTGRSAVRRAAANAVVQAGYGLIELRTDQPTLEEFFVRLTTVERA